MKNKHKIYAGAIVVLLSCMIFAMGCKKKSTTTTSSGISFEVINLVSDIGSYSGARIDTNLVNAWGIAISPAGRIWISSTAKDRTTIYDGSGATQIAAIKIPDAGTRTSHGPTGAVFNNTTEFLIPSDNSLSKFIYANLDGTISAWSSGASAKIVANRAATGASYTGATLGRVGSANYLYAANFAGGKVDVFSSSWQYTISFPFTDPTLPQGFSPYNIVNIGGDLYVTYAPVSGYSSGNGYVNVFSPDGTFIKRFASAGPLNFPWGIAIAPAGFGLGQNMILIGNFGDGTISIFDQNGNYKGKLPSNGSALSIDGLWAITTAPSAAATLDQNVVYFSAGPSFGTHGLFGYVKLSPVMATGGY